MGQPVEKSAQITEIPPTREALEQKDRVLAAMINAAREAHPILRTGFENWRSLTAQFKDGTDEASAFTRVDTDSQAKIKNILETSLAGKEDIDFFGEEAGLDLRSDTAKHRFVIDPLDGTTAFRTGRDYFGISIADMDRDGNIVRSVILDGRTGEMLVGTADGVFEVPYAEQGEDVEIQKLSRKDPDSIGKIAVHKNEPTKPLLKMMDKNLSDKGFEIENRGSLVVDLMGFLKGEYRAVINGGCYWWDIAAAKHMIALQNLRLVDWEGNEPQFNAENPRAPMRILACHSKDLPELQNLITLAKNVHFVEQVEADPFI